jgi:hypothetical protein
MMTKSKFLLIGLVILTGGIVSWTLQHHAATKLREMNDTFQRQTGELGRLREQNSRLSNLISLASKSNSSSLDELRELLRARNEVGQLRYKGRDINQLRSTNDSLLAALSNSQNIATNPVRWSQDELADIGYADPESAIISTLWALNNEGPNPFFSKLTDDEKAQLAREGNSETEIAARSKKMAELLNPASATGISLAGKKFTSADEAIVDLYYEGEGKTRQFAMKRVNGQWRLESLVMIIAN